ncbi:MAG: nuclear envelope integral membrane protein, partial [Paludibacteraceae bacterium]|nr:nuclear envelope integral membrane protein [Paludibacteraceae bacterium]
KIVMGDQTTLKFELAQDKDDKVSCPMFNDTLTAGVELVEALKPDTVDLGDGRIQVNLNYLITAFDSGFYFIPAYKFVSAYDSASSKPLGLMVDTINTEADADINPIKDIMDAPFLWSEFFYWVGIVLAILAFIALVVYLLMKYVFKKEVKIIPQKEEPKIPAHIIALQKLEQIKSEKSWQSGDIKLFYTQVTDVIREYMDNQFSINAMELTTDEILSLAKKNPEFEQVRQILRDMLELSDLVKFAKFIPMEDDNNRSMLNAFAFVEKTMPQPEPESETDADTDSANSKEKEGKL